MFLHTIFSNSKRATVSNIKKGRYAFLSPFWDEVSDEAKVIKVWIEHDIANVCLHCRTLCGTC